MHDSSGDSRQSLHYDSREFVPQVLQLVVQAGVLGGGGAGLDLDDALPGYHTVGSLDLQFALTDCSLDTLRVHFQLEQLDSLYSQLDDEEALILHHHLLDVLGNLAQSRFLQSSLHSPSKLRVIIFL